METTFALTDNLDILLPIALLFLYFVFKLFIGRDVGSTDVILALCELPVDIIFLTLTFLSAFIILRPEHSGEGLLFLVLCLIIAFGIVFARRKSELLFDKGAYWAMSGILLINLVVSITLLVYSTRILTTGSIESETKDEVTINIIFDGNFE